MPLSLYYKGECQRYLSFEDDASLDEIIERYCADHPYKGKGDEFYIYLMEGGGETIMEGSTELPEGSKELVYGAACHWLKCLTEITRSLSDFEWYANIDDIDMIYDKDGWRFPDSGDYPEAWW